MKVAHFIDTEVVGGAEVLVVELSRKLQSCGIDVEIFHFGNPWLTGKCHEYKIASVVVPGHKYYKSILTLPLFSVIFWKFLKDRGVDILHSHLVDPITGACLAAFLNRTPHIGTLHDTHTLEEQPGKLWLLQFAAGLGVGMITVSGNVENFVHSKIRFFKKSFQTIYNGVDLSRYNEACEENKALRAELGLNAEDIVFICVGRLVPIKGHGVLIEAVAKLKQHDNVKLLVVGDGPCRREIEVMIADHGLAGMVMMLGVRNDVPQLLGISDCFVLSSHSEGLSCSVIEAMAAGLPTVVTDVGGNYEVVEHTKTGYLVPADNSEALAEKLEMMLVSEAQRRKMGAAAFSRAVQKFSLETMVRSYQTVYENIRQSRTGKNERKTKNPAPGGFLRALWSRDRHP